MIRTKGGLQRDLLLALLSPALLVAVALVQVYRVQTLDQSSWSGAGFGMFATIDNETYRLVRGFRLEPDGEQRVALPKALERQAFELRVVPSQDRAQDLARAWRDAAGPGELGFAVEVWKLEFDPSGSTVIATTLRREVIE